MVDVRGQLKNIDTAVWRLVQLREALLLVGNEKLADSLENIRTAIEANVKYVRDQLRQAK